jgi:hypothetical protein
MENRRRPHQHYHSLTSEWLRFSGLSFAHLPCLLAFDSDTLLAKTLSIPSISNCVKFLLHLCIQPSLEPPFRLCIHLIFAHTSTLPPNGRLILTWLGRIEKLMINEFLCLCILLGPYTFLCFGGYFTLLMIELLGLGWHSVVYIGVGDFLFCEYTVSLLALFACLLVYGQRVQIWSFLVTRQKEWVT